MAPKQYFRRFEPCKYIKEFGEQTSLHGLRYIVRRNYHFSETLMWLLAVTLAVYGATKLIYDSWSRYNSNPTVISLEKNYREWNLPMPAATVCYLERMNETRAADYILKKWNINPSSSEYELYHNFVNAVTNLSYENLEDLKDFTEKKEMVSMTGEELLMMAHENMVNIHYQDNIFDKAYNYIVFRETLTEMGICFTFSGVVSNYHTVKESPIPTYGIPYCNYFLSICSVSVENFPKAIRFYIHSPYEIPDFSDKYYTVENNTEWDTTWKYEEMTASPQLRNLKPSQRQCRYFEPHDDLCAFYEVGDSSEAVEFPTVGKCDTCRSFTNKIRICKRFMDEPLPGDRVYSYNLCRMRCRKILAYQLCGCAPYFYMKDPSIPLCGVQGLSCLSNYKEQIIKIESKIDGSSFCYCPSECEYVTFYPEEEIKRTWRYPMPPNIRFRWAVQRYSKTRQKRDVIFGFEDLLVSLGGTAALFLGCSVLSFVEIGYFFLFGFYGMSSTPEELENNTQELE